jgi:hypothetical protein
MEVGELNSIFRRMSDADQQNRDRGIRNTKATANIDGSMFSDRDANELVRDGGNVDGFNLFAKHLRGVAGSYLSNWFNPKFSSASDDNGLTPDTLKKIEEIFASDKDLNGYKRSSAQCIWDGLTYRGVEEIVVNRPRLSDPRTWNIGFKPIRAESIVFDPANNENRISRNSQRACKFSYYSQVKLEQMYPHKKLDIRKAFLNLENQDYDNVGDIHTAVLDGDKASRNNRWQVVEYYHIENEFVNTRVHIDSWTPVPDFGVTRNSIEYKAALLAWGITNGVSTKDSDLVDVEDTIPTLYVEVWIPELSIILDSGKDERQLDGHLPFYAWSYAEIYGTSIGLVDTLWSCVQDFNAREKAKTKAIEKAPVDKTALDPRFFGDNAAKQRQAIAEFSDPSKPLIADPSIPMGSMSKLIHTIPAGSMNQNINTDIREKLSLMSELSGLTPAMQGITERTGESGTLFQRKVIEGSIQQRYPQEALMQHEHDKAADWIKLVPVVYGGAANYNRKFRKAGTRDFIMVNEFLGYEDDGITPIIKNDLSNIERVEITIGKSNESDFAKQAAREYDLEMLKVIKINETNSEIIAVIENNLARNMNFTSDEEKREMEEAIERRTILEKQKAESKIEEYDSRIAQANAAEGQAVQTQALLELDTKTKVGQMTVANVNSEMQTLQLNSQINQMTASAQPQSGEATANNMQAPAELQGQQS